MAQYSLFVLKVPLNPKLTNKQTHNHLCMLGVGELLSMGYGFVEYKKLSAAKEALKVLQHTMLDGHQLELKLSNRTTLSVLPVLHYIRVCIFDDFEMPGFQ